MITKRRYFACGIYKHQFAVVVGGKDENQLYTSLGELIDLQGIGGWIATEPFLYPGQPSLRGPTVSKMVEYNGDLFLIGGDIATPRTIVNYIFKFDGHFWNPLQDTSLKVPRWKHEAIMVSRSILDFCL